MPTVGFDQQPALRDADQRVMGLVVPRRRKQRLVGRHQRDSTGVSKLDERRLHGALGRAAMPLQLDIEAVAEQPRQCLAAPVCEIGLTGEDSCIDGAVRPSGEGNQSIGPAVEPCECEARLLIGWRLQKGPRIEPHQAAISDLPCGQENDARTLQGRSACGSRLLITEIHRQCAADDWLNPHARHFLGEFEHAEHVVGVGECERRLTVSLCKFGKPADCQRAFEQGIRGVHVQMHEAGHSILAILGTDVMVRITIRAVHRGYGSSRFGLPYPQISGLPKGHDDLRPHGDRAEKKGKRSQRCGFLDDSSDHCISPEHTMNNIHDMFYSACQGYFS